MRLIFEKTVRNHAQNHKTCSFMVSSYNVESVQVPCVFAELLKAHGLRIQGKGSLQGTSNDPLGNRHRLSGLNAIRLVASIIPLQRTRTLPKTWPGRSWD